jgi:hypothetical protein
LRHAVRIAYIISAYKQPDLLLRLIDRLNENTTNFLVHVDKKTDQHIFDRIVNGTRHMPNVRLLERHYCYWGDFGHVLATLKGIDEIYRKHIPFDYAVLLTGQDYPIKTNRQIHGFFEHSSGKSFMAYFALPNSEWSNGGLQRVERWHLRFRDHHFEFPGTNASSIRRRLPGGLKPFGGSSYWCLSRACIEYIYEFTHTNVRVVNFFRYVDVPDEIFFQTILMNSRYATDIINEDMRYIEWRDLNSGNPSVLSKDDFPKLSASSKLFARKFDERVDMDILDMVDREILEVTDRTVVR